MRFKFALLLTLILIGTMFQNSFITASTNDFVSYGTAIEVVANYLDNLDEDHFYYEEWKFDNLEMNLREYLYDFDDTIIGYYIGVYKDNTPIGYFLISASYSITPILEYSNAPYNEDFLKKEKGEKIYYFGGVNYTFAADKNELAHQHKEALKINSNNSEFSSLDYYNPPLELMSLNAKRNSEYRSDWESYLNKPSYESRGITSLSTLPDQYHVNVPHYSQYQTGVIGENSACGPATGAMLTQSFSRFPEVRTTNQLGGQVSSINEHRVAMRTLITGTTMYGFIQGHTNILNNRTDRWRLSEVRGTQSGALETFKNRIVSGLPPAVMWTKFPWQAAEVTWHWQAAHGYRLNTNTWRTEMLVREPSWSHGTSRVFEFTTNAPDFSFVRYYRS